MERGRSLFELGETMTPATLLAFLGHLRPGSATLREEYGEQADWGTAERIAADTFDLLAAVNTPKGRNAPKYPRPKPKRREPEETMTQEEWDEYLRGLVENG